MSRRLPGSDPAAAPTCDVNSPECTIDENLHLYSCTFNRMFSSLLFKFSDKAYLFELLSVRCVRHRSARVPFPFLRRVNVDCER